MNKKILLLLSVLAAGLGPAVSTEEAHAQGGKQTDPEKFYRAPGTIHGKSVLIPMGSHFEGRMNETIGSRTRQGQKFSIEVTSPVLANAQDVIIPSGSRIIGEVVEALPSSKQRKIKGQPKPIGKLRTQLSSLVTPDGMTYPIVATIMPEYIKSGKYSKANRDLSTPSMGYVGSQSSFDAVHPGFDTRAGAGNRGPKVVNRREFFRDPIMGNDGGRGTGSQYGTPVIRSIVRKGNEIFIYSGSPLTVRLDAPLKLTMAPSKGALSIDLDEVTPALEDGPSGGNFRRFQPASRNVQPEDEEAQQPPPQATAPVQTAPDPDDGLPGFLRKKKSFFPQNGAPQGMQQGGPPQNFQQGGPPPTFQQQGQPPSFQQQGQQQGFQQQQQGFQQQTQPGFQQQAQPMVQQQQAPPQQQEGASAKPAESF
jgi:hypothetical protein